MSQAKIVTSITSAWIDQFNKLVDLPRAIAIVTRHYSVSVELELSSLKKIRNELRQLYKLRDANDIDEETKVNISPKISCILSRLNRHAYFWEITNNLSVWSELRTEIMTYLRLLGCNNPIPTCRDYSIRRVIIQKIMHFITTRPDSPGYLKKIQEYLRKTDVSITYEERVDSAITLFEYLLSNVTTLFLNKNFALTIYRKTQELSRDDSVCGPDPVKNGHKLVRICGLVRKKIEKIWFDLASTVILLEQRQRIDMALNIEDRQVVLNSPLHLKKIGEQLEEKVPGSVKIIDSLLNGIDRNDPNFPIILLGVYERMLNIQDEE